MRGVVEIRGGDDGHARRFEDIVPGLDVRSLETDDERNLEIDLFGRGDDARGDDVALHDAAKDVDEDGLDVVVHGEDLEGLDDLLLLGGAADVEEVRGGA